MSSAQQPSTSTSCTNPVSPSSLKESLGDLRSQSKKIISNVYTFLRNLKEEGLETLDLHRPQELTAKMCGVSLSSVKRITAAAPDFDSPRKKYKREKTVTRLDECDKDIIRRTIFDFYDKGEYPTIRKLKMDLKDKINYEGSETSLRNVLKEIGFRYRKSSDGRKQLMERSDIALARIKFLRKMHSLRQSGDTRPVFYLDETWVNQNHSRSHTWQDASGSGGLNVPIGKGGRLIICHIGSAKTGFMPESRLVFRANVKSFDEDYHSQMNSTIFKDWFINSVLKLLDEPSVIVMDNASYHSVLLEKWPTTNYKKSEIVEWLDKKHVQYPPNLTKVELLKIANKHKPPEKIFELDQIALEHGHEVVRLPPYHCQYNPIELIWAQIKREVADHNTTFKMVDIEKITHEAINNVTIENWKSCVKHAEELQEDDFRKEIVRDDVQPLIIHFGDDESSSASDYDSS